MGFQREEGGVRFFCLSCYPTMKLIDTLSLAYRTISGNKLRTGITVAIIAFGIMALVGINTAIDAMKQKFTESFSAMGANGFTIHYKNWFNFNNNGPKAQKKSALKEKKSNNNVPITLRSFLLI